MKSKVGWYNAIYVGLSWAYPLLQRGFPGMVTSSEAVGRAMLKVARDGWPYRVLENKQINAAGAV